MTPQRPELDPQAREILQEEAEREAELRRSEAAAMEHQDEMPLAEAEDPAEPEGEPHDGDGDYAAETPEEPTGADDALDAAISDMLADAAEPETPAGTDDAADDMAAADTSDADGDEDDSDAAIAAALAGSAGGAGAAAGNSRRDLLPDIEEINSTLRATEDRSTRDPLASDFDTVETRPRRRGFRLGFGLVLLILAGLIAIYANAPRITEAVPQAGPVLQSYVGQVDRLRLLIDDLAQGALSSGEAPQEAPAPPEVEENVDQPNPPDEDGEAEEGGSDS